jgi:YD repeat-containing protein
MIVKTKLLSFALLLFIAACSSDDEPGTCLISKIESSSTGAVQTTFNVFHTDEKISAIQAIRHTQANQKDTWLITWQGEDISTVEFQVDGTAAEDHYTYTYSTDLSSGVYTKYNGANIVFTSEWRELYLNVPPADGIYYIDGSFYEAQGGNIIRSGHYDVVNSSNVISPDGQTTYEYDDKPNTLKHLVRLPNFLFLGFETARINSENNLTKVNFSDGFSRTFTYTHDDKGRLLNIVDTGGGKQYAFSYECK